VGIADSALIRQPRQLGRALSPLSRWVEHGPACQLDVAATVEAIARARTNGSPWQPCLRPRREPWLELQLVFDASPSMALWQRLRRELPRLLTRQVRWRDLRCWQLVSGPEGGLGLRSLQGRFWAPRRLHQRAERSLVLVVSDAVAPAWFDGSMAQLLRGWAAVQPVALLQVFPQRLWLRTALAQQPAGWIQAAAPMRPHGQLSWQPVEGGPPLPGQAAADPLVTLPVLRLQADFLGAWARLLTGSREGSALAYRFALRPEDPGGEEEPATLEDTLAMFLFTASSSARRLLALLTYAPVISLPIVRLLHAQMVGTAGADAVAEQAEVLFSGLFAPAAARPERPIPIDQRRLCFADESLRLRLREGLLVWQARAVFDRVKQFVASSLNLQVETFEALLLAPDQCESHSDPDLLKAFATLAPSCLRGLGPRYESFADALERRWPPPVATASRQSWLQGLVVKEEEFPTALLLPIPAPETIPFTTAGLEPMALERITFPTARVIREQGEFTVRQGRGEGWAFFETLQPRITLTLVEIPAGGFKMGSSDGERERHENEGPQHVVTLESFFMSQTPITQAQWRVVAQWQEREGERWGRKLPPNPSRFSKRPDSAKRPVEGVRWLEAMEFCNRLSQRTGLTYTLPSEAQWEYACRAGTATPFAFGDTITPELANYNANYTYANGPNGENRRQTVPVGSFPANDWGLHDMHGNVWEWCLDRWHPNYKGAPSYGWAWDDQEREVVRSKKDGDEGNRLLRGGSWYFLPEDCRSAYRNRNLPGFRANNIGFRVCCLPQGRSTSPLVP
jgi:formylglycine-generating enzyme required for sulfatase activity